MWAGVVVVEVGRSSCVSLFVDGVWIILFSGVMLCRRVSILSCRVMWEGIVVTGVSAVLVVGHRHDGVVVSFVPFDV